MSRQFVFIGEFPAAGGSQMCLEQLLLNVSPNDPLAPLQIRIRWRIRIGRVRGRVTQYVRNALFYYRRQQQFIPRQAEYERRVRENEFRR